MTAETAVLVPDLRAPTPAALRWDKTRRTFESKWTTIGVAAAAVGTAIALPLSGILPLGLAGAYFGGLVVFRFRLQRFISSMRSAYDAAERGDFDPAFAKCAAAMREPWPVSHLGALTMAYFLRRQGEFDKAIEMAGQAAKTEDGSLRRLIGIELAVCYALKGASGPASTWLPPITRKHDVTSASYGIVYSRAGETTRVLGLRVRQRGSLAYFVRHEIRILAIMKALALFRERGDYLSIRPMLLEAVPAFPGEFDYLGKEWPKMKEFVETYVTPN